MKDAARPPQPVQECCVSSGILWDLAAVYATGALWSDQMPPAAFFNGPIVDVMFPLEAALVAVPRDSVLSPSAAQWMELASK